MICEFCESWYLVPKRFEKFTEVGPAFCRLNCLKEYVERLKPDRGIADWLVKSPIRVPPTQAVKSLLLNMSFRSNFEVDVAEVFVFDFGWSSSVSYEEVGVPLDDNHIYTPDFVKRDNLAFIEVKGTWMLGGQNKYRKAQAILGRERLIPVGPQYAAEFAKRAIAIRRSHGLR